MGATIRDVAQHAGVSIATVSRVLRGTATVAPQTRDRVTAAVDELRFTPSQLGRQLAERRHAANGIVFPDLSGPYFAEVVLGYEAVAAELGRSVLILSTHGREAAPAPGRADGRSLRRPGRPRPHRHRRGGRAVDRPGHPPGAAGPSARRSVRLGQRRERAERRRAGAAPPRAGCPPAAVRRGPGGVVRRGGALAGGRRRGGRAPAPSCSLEPADGFGEEAGTAVAARLLAGSDRAAGRVGVRQRRARPRGDDGPEGTEESTSPAR